MGNTERVELGPDLVDDIVDRVVGALAGDVDGPLGEHVAETVELLRNAEQIDDLSLSLVGRLPPPSSTAQTASPSR